MSGRLSVLRLFRTVISRPENSSTVIMVGFLFSTCFTLFILRGLFFSPGLVASGDATFSHIMAWNRDLFTHSWSQFVGWDNSRRIMDLPLMLPLTCLFSNAGTFTKALYFLMFTLIGTISFSVAFAWLRDIGTRVSLSYVGALVAALVYSSSTYVFMVMSHFGGLFSYALLPLTFYFARAAFAQRSYSVKSSLKYATILGLVLMLATTMYYVFTLHVIVLVATAISQIIPRLLDKGHPRKTYLCYTVGLTGLTSLLFALFWAWYILPFLLSHSMGLIQFRHNIVDGSYISAAAHNGTLLNVVRTLGFYDQSLLDCSGAFRTLWVISTLVVPIMAAAAIMIRPKSRDILVLGTLAIIGILLVKGPNAPFGSQYLWFVSHFEQPFATGGLYFPIRAVPLIILAYALLSSYAVTQALGLLKARVLRWRVSLSIGMVILVCAFVLVSSFPILTGDNRGTMNPAVVPQPYHDANGWLLGDRQEYKVAWLPPSTAVEWNPHAGSADQWSKEYLAYLPALLSAKSITSEAGFALENRPVERARLEQYIYYLLDSGTERQVGALLAMENAKYILYHDDVKDRDQYADLYASLTESDDLSLAYSDDYISIFENTEYLPYVQTTGGAILIVGGLDALGSQTMAEWGVPYNRPLLFLEQSAGTANQIQTVLDSTECVVFYANKDIDDLVLSSLDSSFYHAALGCWDKDYQSPWKRDFFYSVNWCGRILSQGTASTWDFDLNLGIMHTSEADAELDFDVDTKEASYELWVRNLVGKDGSSLQASVDGDMMADLSSYSGEVEGFQWQRIGQIGFSKGRHTITLKTLGNGFNAINAVAVVPTQALEEHRDSILDWIQGSDIKLIYLTDYLKMPRSGEIPGMVLSDNPLDWQAGDGVVTVSSDTANFVQGGSSLRVEGTGTEKVSSSISYPSLSEEYFSNGSLELSLYFESIPAELQELRVIISGGGSQMEWDIGRGVLKQGEWQAFSFSFDDPTKKRIYGSTSDPPCLTIEAAIPEGCGYSYNIDDPKLVNVIRSAEFDTPEQQDYMAAIYVAPDGDDSVLSVYVDSHRYDLTVEKAGWLYVALPALPQGTHEIAVGGHATEVRNLAVYPIDSFTDSLASVVGPDVQSSVTDYKVVSKTRIKVTVEVSEPCILSFGESSHSSWIATDDEGNRLPQIALNSVTNGFLIERTGTYEIVLEFELEKHLNTGKAISGLTLVVLVGTLAFIHYREKRKARTTAPT
jgi:hypothetical protein